MDFGLAHIPFGHYKKSVDLVKSAEAAGYEVAWIPDQTFHRDFLPMATAFALSTSRIKIGIGICNPFTLHPALIARAMATLDEISGGRLIVGMGTGNKRDLLRPLGIEGLNGFKRCAEAIAIFKALLRCEKVDHEGELFRAEGVKLCFKPFRQTPIYIAGLGPKILQVAGRYADGAIMNFASPASFDYALGEVGRGARAAGRSLDALVKVAWAVCIISSRNKDSYDKIRPFIAHTIAPTADEVLARLGLEPGKMALLRKAYFESGPQQAARFVDDALCDIWAIVGSEAHCRERVKEIAAKGIDHLAILPWSSKWEDVAATAACFAKEVIAKL